MFGSVRRFSGKYFKTIGGEAVNLFTYLIETNPEDRSLWEVYADWLKEQGSKLEEVVYRVALCSDIVSGTKMTERVVENTLEMPHGLISRYQKCPFPSCGFLGITERYQRKAHLDYGKQIGNWVSINLSELEKLAAKERREASWLEKSHNGSAAALLAHPEGRKAIEGLVAGQQGFDTARAMKYTSSRKTINEAKTILLRRNERRLLRNNG
jgi:uncharacterized protein (TIGR02996 family)